MKKVVFNDDEFTALAGLPPDVLALYFWLRVRMDFITGLVGDHPRISWHALTEDLYVVPHPGPRRHGSPSVQQARRLARHLERAKLVVMKSSEVHRMLVFELPLATQHKHVQKKPDRHPTAQPDRQPDRPPQRGKPPQPDRQPDRPQTPQPDTHQVLSSTSTTTPLEGLLSAPAGADEDQGLIYPPGLSTGDKGVCRRAVAQLDQDRAQELLDELTGAMQTTDVRKPGRYLMHLAERLKDGTFFPSTAHLAREAREHAARIAEQAEASRASAAPGRKFTRGELVAQVNQRRH